MKKNFLITLCLSLALSIPALRAEEYRSESLNRAVAAATKLVKANSNQPKNPALRLIFVNDNGLDEPFAMEIASYKLEGDTTVLNEHAGEGKSHIIWEGKLLRKGANTLIFSGKYDIAVAFPLGRQVAGRPAGVGHGFADAGEYQALRLKRGIPVPFSSSEEVNNPGEPPFVERNHLLLIWY